MRKRFFIGLALIMTLCFNSYALESNPLVEMRNKFFEESKEIKILLTSNSKDIILVSSLWDSCIITVNQLDAYFYMVAIFESVKKGSTTDTTIDYLVSWLTEIKKTNLSNINSLRDSSLLSGPKTKVYISRLLGDFAELNGMIDDETNKINVLKKSSSAKKR